MSNVEQLNVMESTGPPVEDLAREAWLLERAAEGEVSLLLTSWEGPVVVLGFGQRPEDADLEWCCSQGLPVLRRLTGGTGVVHRGDLGVGLALPQVHPWAKGIIGLYGRFLDVLEPALTAVGAEVSRLAEPRRGSRVRSPVCFLDQLSDTLVVDGRKAVGCAQTRRRGGVLIHAAVLLGLDAGLYARIFDVPEDVVFARRSPRSWQRPLVSKRFANPWSWSRNDSSSRTTAHGGFRHEVQTFERLNVERSNVAMPGTSGELPVSERASREDARHVDMRLRTTSCRDARHLR